MRASRPVAAAALVPLLLAGCGQGLGGAGLGPGDPAAATPLTATTTAIETTAATLSAALGRGGYALDPGNGPFRSSEPATFIGASRAVYRVRLADPSDGVVVIYQWPDANAAGSAAAALADYIGGFGRMSYPGDALFSVGQLGPTVILSWYSGGRSDDPEAARGAFDLIATVGRPYPVPP